MSDAVKELREYLDNGPHDTYEPYEIADEALTALEAVLELHRPETWYYLEDSPEWTYPTKQEISEAFDVGIDYTEDDIRSFQVCTHCAEVEQGAAEDLGHLTALWPCDTRKTIVKALGGSDDE